MHQGTAPQNTRPNIVHRSQVSRPTNDPNAMDIDALNLSSIE